MIRPKGDIFKIPDFVCAYNHNVCYCNLQRADFIARHVTAGPSLVESFFVKVIETEAGRDSSDRSTWIWTVAYITPKNTRWGHWVHATFCRQSTTELRTTSERHTNFYARYTRTREPPSTDRTDTASSRRVVDIDAISSRPEFAFATTSGFQVTLPCAWRMESEMRMTQVHLPPIL